MICLKLHNKKDLLVLLFVERPHDAMCIQPYANTPASGFHAFVSSETQDYTYIISCASIFTMYLVFMYKTNLQNTRQHCIV